MNYKVIKIAMFKVEETLNEYYQEGWKFVAVLVKENPRMSYHDVSLIVLLERIYDE